MNDRARLAELFRESQALQQDAAEAADRASLAHARVKDAAEQMAQGLMNPQTFQAAQRAYDGARAALDEANRSIGRNRLARLEILNETRGGA
jgi:hypothetical protein